MAILLNVSSFQFGWFAAVLSANRQQPWLGAVIMAAVVLLHLRTVRRACPELQLLIYCGVIGSIWDSLLVASGWVAYPSGTVLPGFAPYWIVVMWMLFATTLNRSLGWLKPHKSLAVLLGAVAGPLSYIAGSQLGGIELLDADAAIVALSVGWGALLPLVLSLAERYDGVSVKSHAALGWSTNR